MRKVLSLLVLLSGISMRAAAHVIDFELDPEPAGNVFLTYLKAGFEHIIPLGTDHILFILCVFFLNASLKKIILQASMFTLAHSLTLGLAMYGIIDPPLHIVEPLIAASIVFLALENIASEKVKPWRMAMVFLFGMVHGMGFAGALSELGMPKNAFTTALIAFNVGVELGQLAIILFLWLVLARPFGKRPWYRPYVVIPTSVIIAAVALWWTVERIFFTA